MGHKNKSIALLFHVQNVISVQICATSFLDPHYYPLELIIEFSFPKDGTKIAIKCLDCI